MSWVILVVFVPNGLYLLLDEVLFFKWKLFDFASIFIIHIIVHRLVNFFDWLLDKLVLFVGWISANWGLFVILLITWTSRTTFWVLFETGDELESAFLRRKSLVLLGREVSWRLTLLSTWGFRSLTSRWMFIINRFTWHKVVCERSLLYRQLIACLTPSSVRSNRPRACTSDVFRTSFLMCWGILNLSIYSLKLRRLYFVEWLILSVASLVLNLINLVCKNRCLSWAFCSTMILIYTLWGHIKTCQVLLILRRIKFKTNLVYARFWWNAFLLI